jgi:hypothetical protein
MAIDEDRLEDLQELWERETNDPDTQEWRDDLTQEEHQLVAEWDANYSNAVGAICKEITEVRKRKGK